jgi:glycosyltransferase involved in cell wall biosynthesis
MKPKVALVVSHPIQHFCPQYVSFANNSEIVFKVFFASALGYKKYIDPNFKKEISWGNLQLDRFDHTFLNGEVAIPSDKMIDAVKLDEALVEFNPDLVIIYGYFQKLQRRAHRWAYKNKVQLAYISDSERRHDRNRFFEAIKYFYVRNYFRRIQYFLSVGDANEEFYNYYGVKSHKIIRMHFPIDIRQYESSYALRDQLRTKVRMQYGIAEKDIVLSVVGKLAPWKNQDHIIDALKLLEEEGIYMHLFILGSGEMMELWRQRSANLKHSKVYFPGFVNIEELPAYYAASDIYVHPASVEPHSIAVSESIFMGCPVILSSKCGSFGPTDDVQENRNGYVYTFGNISELATKIKSLAADTDKRKEFSEHSRSIARVFQENAHVMVLDKLVKHMRGR